MANPFIAGLFGGLRGGLEGHQQDVAGRERKEDRLFRKDQARQQQIMRDIQMARQQRMDALTEQRTQAQIAADNALTVDRTRPPEVKWERVRGEDGNYYERDTAHDVTRPVNDPTGKPLRAPPPFRPATQASGDAARDRKTLFRQRFLYYLTPKRDKYGDQIEGTGLSAQQARTRAQQEVDEAYGPPEGGVTRTKDASETMPTNGMAGARGIYNSPSTTTPAPNDEEESPDEGTPDVSSIPPEWMEHAKRDPEYAQYLTDTLGLPAGRLLQ